mmetsp:Transcript_23991/g.27928  ORF Transcript_23991/g.27928 Transcript_23991/m.27928 type:complete len:212 (-) Transcript_23991:103-738(-)
MAEKNMNNRMVRKTSTIKIIKLVTIETMAGFPGIITEIKAKLIDIEEIKAELKPKEVDILETITDSTEIIAETLEIILADSIEVTIDSPVEKANLTKKIIGKQETKVAMQEKVLTTKIHRTLVLTKMITLKANLLTLSDLITLNPTSIKTENFSLAINHRISSLVHQITIQVGKLDLNKDQPISLLLSKAKKSNLRRVIVYMRSQFIYSFL